MAFSVLVIVSNVTRSIQIGIKLETTMLALEQTLLLPVAPLDMSTSRTALRGVTSINMTNDTFFESSLVSQESFELKETPTVYQELLFLPEFFTAVSDVRQVFKHKCGSLRKTINNPFRDDMVHVSPKTVLLHTQFTKVPFGRACSLGLQYLSQVPVPIYDSFYLSSSEELVGGSDCNFVDAPIDTDNDARRFDVRNVFLENDSEKNFVTSDKKFGRFSSPVFVLLKVGRSFETELLSSRNSGNGKCVSVNPHVVGVMVVSDAGLLGNRTGCLLSFSDYGLDTFQRFGCFVSSRARELRRQKSFAVLVCFVVKRNCVAVTVFPTDGTDVVEGFGVCLDCWHDRSDGCFEFDFDCLSQYHTSYYKV